MSNSALSMRISTIWKYSDETAIHHIKTWGRNTTKVFKSLERCSASVASSGSRQKPNNIIFTLEIYPLLYYKKMSFEDAREYCLDCEIKRLLNWNVALQNYVQTELLNLICNWNWSGNWSANLIFLKSWIGKLYFIFFLHLNRVNI